VSVSFIDANSQPQTCSPPMAPCPSNTHRTRRSNSHNLLTQLALLPNLKPRQVGERHSPNLAHHKKVIKPTHLQLNLRRGLKQHMRPNRTNTHPKSSVIPLMTLQSSHACHDASLTRHYRLRVCSKRRCKTRQTNTRHQIIRTTLQPKNTHRTCHRLRLNLHNHPRAMLRSHLNSTPHRRMYRMGSHQLHTNDRHHTSRHRRRAHRRYHSPDPTQHLALQPRRPGQQVGIKHTRDLRVSWEARRPVQAIRRQRMLAEETLRAFIGKLVAEHLAACRPVSCGRSVAMNSCRGQV
jgi:hypothetical protein